MKVAVTSTGDSLEAQIDLRFGRCQYFVIIDPESMEFEAIANPNIAAAGGAGIQSAQMVASKEVKAVLTGNCGPNAFSTLNAAGVDVVTGLSGTVEEAIKEYKAGKLKPTQEATVGEKSGMGQGGGSGVGPSGTPGTGLGPGRGGGRGMGRGVGRGGGRGGGGDRGRSRGRF